MKDATLKTLTYLAFAGLILLSHACGKANGSGGTLGPHKPYELCSKASEAQGCTVEESGQKLGIYDFYDRYCYKEYIQCLKAYEFERKKQ